ncbi:putative MFS family arabinose efflux permease [Hamadaea flava]|uniref:MFS transporter n=1 Tax=Hamadaea flava TaxID=1742688 RepID=A0ABV8LMK0_9ACTN|nr:MFS transporter [Hamadaea flava]MCP2321534.1 putative MFS family arabinose efflux permease [Hamadaea flava]
MADTPRPAPWPLASLLLVAAGTFLSVTTEMLPMGLLSSIAHDLRVSEPSVGLLVTGYALMVALFAAPLGRATARLPRRALFVGTLIAYAGSSVLMAVSVAYPIAVAARLFGGLAHGVFWAMVAGYVARLVPPERLGRAVTVVFSGGTVAVLVGVPLGTGLGVAIGWRASFLALSAATALVALAASRLLPPMPGETTATETSLVRVLRTPSVTVVAITTALTMLGYFAFYTYISPFLQAAGISEQALGPALFGYGVAGAVGLFLAGMLVDRRPRLAMLAGGGLLTGALVFLGVVPNGAALAVVGIMAAGLALNGLAVLVQAAILRAALPQAGDTASALNASAFNIGIGGGALLGGQVLAAWGTGALPVVAAVLTGAGLAGVVYGRRDGFPALIETERDAGAPTQAAPISAS